MATYFFETINAAQAMAFSPTDSLVFTNTTSSGAKMTVLYNPAAGATPETVTIIDNADGHAVTFGSGVEGLGESASHIAVFPDGSTLIVGSATDENVVLTTPAADGMFGGLGNDSLIGSPGNDLLQGNGGNDSLSGGATTSASNGGNDTIYGGQGDDTIDVGGGSNVAQGNIGNDTITAAHGAAADTASTNLLLGGQGDDSIMGGAGVDTLVGDLGNDTLHGGGGSDSLSGADGNDVIFVDLSAGGNDVVVVDGGNGNDTISDSNGGASSLLGGQGDDSIVISGTGKMFVDGNLGDDTIAATAASGNNSILGEGGNDSLTGGSGDDTIDAGTGDDTIHGGGGADSITAGGTATFTFSTGDSPAAPLRFDQIFGWHPGGSDHLSFGLGASSPFNLDMVSTSATTFSGAVSLANGIIGGGTYVAVPLNSDLLIFADTNGDHQITAADTAVLLVGQALSAIDFGTIR